MGELNEKRSVATTYSGKLKRNTFYTSRIDRIAESDRTCLEFCSFRPSVKIQIRFPYESRGPRITNKRQRMLPGLVVANDDEQWKTQKPKIVALVVRTRLEFRSISLHRYDTFCRVEHEEFTFMRHETTRNIH